jgi:hypothetical protein
MTRFHGCLSWSYDATAALGHEFAGAGLGYQWLPRSEAAGRLCPAVQASHRPIRDNRNVRISGARPDLPGSGVPDFFLSYSSPRFSASHDQPAADEALPCTGGFCLGRGGCLSAAMRPALESVPRT